MLDGRQYLRYGSSYEGAVMDCMKMSVRWIIGVDGSSQEMRYRSKQQPI